MTFDLSIFAVVFAIGGWMLAALLFAQLGIDRIRASERRRQSFDRGTEHGRLLQRSADSKARSNAAIRGHRKRAQAREDAAIEGMMKGGKDGQ